MSDDARVPFAHELFGVGIWLLGVVGILVALDPAGTTVPYALVSLAVACVGGFLLAMVPFVLIRVSLQVVVGIDVVERQPTAVGLAVPVAATLFASALLFGPAVAVLDAVQPGTTGDHPFRKGVRGATLLTLGAVATVADPLCLTVLDRLGVRIVRPAPEAGDGDERDAAPDPDAEPGADADTTRESPE
jgi:hypothetical protein